MDAIVSPQQLQEIVDCYGEDPTAWPVGLRRPAQELVDGCAEARAILEQAKKLREQLRDLGPAAPDCFTDRVVAVALELDPPLDFLFRHRN